MHFTERFFVLIKADDLQLLAHDLTIGKMVGKGTFGEVFQGDFRGKEVAVKVIDIKGSGVRLDAAVQEIETLM